MSSDSFIKYKKGGLGDAYINVLKRINKRNGCLKHLKTKLCLNPIVSIRHQVPVFTRLTEESWRYYSYVSNAINYLTTRQTYWRCNPPWISASFFVKTEGEYQHHKRKKEENSGKNTRKALLIFRRSLLFQFPNFFLSTNILLLEFQDNLLKQRKGGVW